jgi:hypothetical protein
MGRGPEHNGTEVNGEGGKCRATEGDTGEGVENGGYSLSLCALTERFSASGLTGTSLPLGNSSELG